MVDAILRHMLIMWGRQWRRVWVGGTVLHDQNGAVLHRHLDGYPTTSLSAFGERVSRGTSGGRDWPEVYTGDGLVIHRGLQHLAEQPRLSIVLSYGVRTPEDRPYPARERAEAMGLSRARFWEIFNFAEGQLSTYVAGVSDAECAPSDVDTSKPAKSSAFARAGGLLTQKRG